MLRGSEGGLSGRRGVSRNPGLPYRYRVVGYGMVLFGMVCYGMLWYGTI